MMTVHVNYSGEQGYAIFLNYLTTGAMYVDEFEYNCAW